MMSKWVWAGLREQVKYNVLQWFTHFTALGNSITNHLKEVFGRIHLQDLKKIQTKIKLEHFYLKQQHKHMYIYGQDTHSKIKIYVKSYYFQISSLPK